MQEGGHDDDEEEEEEEEEERRKRRRRPGLRQVVQMQVRKGWMNKRVRMNPIKCITILE